MITVYDWVWLGSFHNNCKVAPGSTQGILFEAPGMPLS